LKLTHLLIVGDVCEKAQDLSRRVGPTSRSSSLSISIADSQSSTAPSDETAPSSIASSRRGTLAVVNPGPSKIVGAFDRLDSDYEPSSLLGFPAAAPSNTTSSWPPPPSAPALPPTVHTGATSTAPVAEDNIHAYFRNAALIGSSNVQARSQRVMEDPSGGEPHNFRTMSVRDGNYGGWIPQGQSPQHSCWHVDRQAGTWPSCGERDAEYGEVHYYSSCVFERLQ
jgi:hypothetical protein